MSEPSKASCDYAATIEDARARCTHCGACQNVCDFLTKYDLMIGDVDELDLVRDSCFLCGQCTRACPESIDGRQLLWDLRALAAERRGSLKTLLRGGSYPLEKLHYPFKNYRRAGTISFFPGCSLLSNFPRTASALSLWLEQYGIGTICDCCGSPIHELGLDGTADQVLKRLETRLEKAGVTDLLVACPHCYVRMNGRISQQVTPLLAVIEELSDEAVMRRLESLSDWDLFVPCPDRDGNSGLFAAIKHLCGPGMHAQRSVQCCGLGGNAAKYEPELAEEMAHSIAQRKNRPLFSYCASCAHAIGKKTQREGRHLLSVIVGVDEAADVRRSFFNRLGSKFR